MIRSFCFPSSLGFEANEILERIAVLPEFCFNQDEVAGFGNSSQIAGVRGVADYGRKQPLEFSGPAEQGWVGPELGGGVFFGGKQTIIAGPEVMPDLRAGNLVDH